MFRAILYLLKMLILVGGVIILYVQPGTMVATWGDYTVSIRLGVFAAVLLILIWMIVFLSGALTRLALWPRDFMRTRRERRRIKGYRALLQSMTAAAIGDKKTAFYLAHRAQKLLPTEESGLPMLLKAQAQPDEDKPQEEMFLALLQNADTALLGLQGLTQKAILAGDFTRALNLVRQSVQDFPKNTSLIKALYDMELKNYLWGDALITLKRVEKAKLMEKEDIGRDRCTLYCLLGDMALAGGRDEEALQAYQRACGVSTAFFAPAYTRLARQLLKQGKSSKASALLLKAWRRQPHPDYLRGWMELFAYASEKDKIRGKWMWIKDMTDIHPQSPDSHIALARAAIDGSMWGEAKAELAKAEKFGPRADIYQAWVELESRTTNRPDVIRQWVDRAYTSPKGWAWICSHTGRSYNEWVGVVEPERLFNTLVWQKEDDVGRVSLLPHKLH